MTPPRLRHLLPGLLVLAAVAPGHARAAVSQATPAAGAVKVTLTTGNLRRALSAMPALRFGAIDPAVPTINVDDTTRYQRIVGFGAAMTDTSAWLLYDRLTPIGRAAVMTALFGRDGIALNYVRVPVGASDFTATGRPYTYDDLPPGQADPGLAHFSIAHDERYILPALRQMLGINHDVELLASPWSAPGWMKSNGALDNDNDAGELLPGAYEEYADYLARFLEAYGRAGVRVSAITAANEPHTPTLYPGMDLDEDTFITQYLAPTLARAGLPTAVYGLDGSGLTAAEEMLETGSASLAGIAWHCYAGLAQMSQLHELDPSARLVMDECSPGIVPYSTAETVIASVRNDAQAVDLWNLALTPAGGPKQPVLGCDHCGALVTVNDRRRTARLTLNYYQLGQVAKFVHRGAVRIASDRWVSDFTAAGDVYGVTSGLDNVAFENPGGGKVLVAYNNSPQPIRFQVTWHGRAFAYRLGAGDTVTFTW